MYRAPGALPLPDELLRRWNDLIQTEFENKDNEGLGSALVCTDPAAVVDGNLTRAVKLSLIHI